jgi:ABC-2 type transport system ATP-binding protein
VTDKTPVLIVENLIKKFSTKTGYFTALNGISFNLHEGEILGLLGPNGAGKTTTVQILLSTLTATSGKITMLNKDFFSQRSECLQHVGFASAYVNLPDHLTVHQNLKVHGMIYGLSNNHLISKIEKYLRYFDAWNLRNKQIRELSAGQKTRVMLAKAFMTNPKIVLLDEPTASLDPDIALQVRQFILDQKKERNTSIIFTSHNMDEVIQVCDRILVMRNGEIIANDAPDKLAATISISHLHLLIEEGMEKAVQYAKSQNLHCQISEKWIEIELDERQIAKFLIGLSQIGITYSQIYIDVPSLEDYFLHIAAKPKTK